MIGRFLMGGKDQVLGSPSKSTHLVPAEVSAPWR